MKILVWKVPNEKTRWRQLYYYYFPSNRIKNWLYCKLGPCLDRVARPKKANSFKFYHSTINGKWQIFNISDGW